MIVFSYIALGLAALSVGVALVACAVLWRSGLDAASAVLDAAWAVMIVAGAFLVVGWVT